MTSNDLKTAVLYYCRFKRSWMYIATEVGTYFADVLALNDKHLIEFETKISLSDFKKDFEKIEKHADYMKGEIPDWKNRGCLPNKMFYVVPKDLTDKCLPLLDDQKSKYRLIECSKPYDNSIGHLTIVKKAALLHNEPLSKETILTVVARMSSELVNLRLKDKKDDTLEKDMDID